MSAPVYVPPRPFLKAVCAFDGCHELAVFNCEVCDSTRFCEDHGNAGDDDNWQRPACCWKCGGLVR
jgi:hypothetical protein